MTYSVLHDGHCEPSFLWGYIKDIMYATATESEEDLRRKITRAVKALQLKCYRKQKI